MIQIEARLEGAKELERRLLALERKTARKIVRSAGTAGANIILRQAKANATSMVGGNMGRIMKAALQSRAARKQKRGSYRRIIQFKADPALKHRTKEGKEHYIPFAIEYGHAAPGDAGGAKIVSPIPFLRSAFDQVRRKVEQIVEEKIKAGIERVARGG